MFELLEGGEVLEVPTETPLDEKSAWLAFRDIILGLEYRECKIFIDPGSLLNHWLFYNAIG